MKKDNNKKIHLVSGDDWEGLYINGNLVTEGHQITNEELLEILGVDFNTSLADIDWLEERGSFPEKLTDVKFE